MERKPVSSSHIRSVGYDPRARILEVELNSGTVQQFQGVSDEVYRRLMAAPSLVSYFRDHIEESFTARRIR
jgi:hypothetical protein